MATLRSRLAPFARGPGLAPTVPDPFEVAARRFESTGAERYLWDPVGFARNAIRWPVRPDGTTDGLTDYQAETLQNIVSKLRVAVRGPHGLGKTTTNALAILWFAITREAARLDWKCPTTAGSWHQLEHYLWPEVHKWAARVDWGHLNVDPLRPDRELLHRAIKGHYGEAFAASPARTELIEGAHADHLLFIFDESKAIAIDTFDAAEGALNGTGFAAALAQSTPGEPNGRFFDIHQQKPGLEDWHVRHVRKTEVIAAGRMNPKWAEQRVLQWGFASSVYQNRVEGEFWVSDEEAVVPLSWVEAANERWTEWDRAGRPSQEGRTVRGVDVARGGNDLTAVAKRTGPVVESVQTWNLRDTTEVAYRVKRRMVNQTDLSVVDTIGVGAGVVDLLRRWEQNVIAFNASRKSKRRDRSGDYGFYNQRAAMWWMLREALDPAFDPTLAIPPIDNLIGELTAPRWRLTPGAKLQVESKDDVRKRLGRSTDMADAVAQTLLTDTEFNEPAQQAPLETFSFTDRTTPDDGVFSFS